MTNRNSNFDKAHQAIDRMINWYESHMREVRRITVFPDQYQEFEKATGRHGITKAEKGLWYRGFLIETQR